MGARSQLCLVPNSYEERKASGLSGVTNDVKYRPDIDGLRAIAVIAVILYHAGLPVTGGYVGVDVFFVISGYLITTITASDLDRGSFSLLAFWERRLRRIWPAALFTTSSVLGIGYWLLAPADYVTTAEDALAQLLMAANVHFWLNLDQGYFSESAELRPLLHMWSLAVEEQFYILFPILLVALAKWPARHKVGVCLVLAGASFAASVVMLASHVQAVFYLLPFRAWELLTGAGLALASPGLTRRLGDRPLIQRNLIAFIGACLVLVPCLAYSRSTPFPAAAALPPVAGAALLIAAGLGGDSQPVVLRLLSTAPLRAIGLMSYSLYLWHWPAMAFVRNVRGVYLGPRSIIVSFLATVVLGWLSWRCIEQPFRKPFSKERPDLVRARIRVVVVAVSLSCLLAAVSLTITAASGLRGRFTSEQLQFIEPSWPDSAPFHTGESYAAPMSLPPIGAEDAKRPCFLLLGDSHAAMISTSLDALAREKGVCGAAAIMPGYFPLPGAWIQGSGRSAAVAERWHKSVIEWIRENRPANVILCGNWLWYVPYRGPDGCYSSVAGIQTTSVGDVHNSHPADLFSASLESMIAECDQIDATLWFFHAAPAAKHSMKQLGLRSRVTGRAVELEGIDRQTHDRWNSAYRSAFEQVSKNGMVAVDLAGLFFDKSGRSKVGGDDQCWFADQHHLSEEGVRVFVQPLLEKVVEEMDCLGAHRK